MNLSSAARSLSSEIPMISNPFLLNFLWMRMHVRHLDLARHAPRRPEVEQHYLALVVGERERLAVDVLDVERNGLVPDGELPHRGQIVSAPPVAVATNLGLRWEYLSMKIRYWASARRRTGRGSCRTRRGRNARSPRVRSSSSPSRMNSSRYGDGPFEASRPTSAETRAGAWRRSPLRIPECAATNAVSFATVWSIAAIICSCVVALF